MEKPKLHLTDVIEDTEPLLNRSGEGGFSPLKQELRKLLALISSYSEARQAWDRRRGHSDIQKSEELICQKLNELIAAIEQNRALVQPDLKDSIAMAFSNAQLAILGLQNLQKESTELGINAFWSYPFATTFNRLKKIAQANIDAIQKAQTKYGQPLSNKREDVQNRFIYTLVAFFESNHNWHKEDNEELVKKRIDFVAHFLGLTRPGEKPLKDSTIGRYISNEMANLKKLNARSEPVDR